MTDAEIVARMRKALATWESQARGMRITAAHDLAQMNLADAVRMGQEAVAIEAMAMFMRNCLDADS